MWGVSDSGHGDRAADTWGMADSQAEDFSPPNLCGLFRCWDTINSSLWWIIKAPILTSILVSPPLPTEPRVDSQTQNTQEIGQKGTSGFHHPPRPSTLPLEQVNWREGPQESPQTKAPLQREGLLRSTIEGYPSTGGDSPASSK